MVKGLKNTDAGIIPNDWNVKNIVENSTMKARIGWQGLTVAEYLNKGDYNLITGTDFVDGKIKWDACHFVDKERYIQDKNIQIKVGDILITKDGTIGKIAFVDRLPLPATLNSGVFVIRPKEGTYLPQFLFYIFNSFYFRDFLNKLVAGSTINHLYQKDFVSFIFPLPPTKAEQTAIATALNNADALIQQLKQLISKKIAIRNEISRDLLSENRKVGNSSEKWNEVSIEKLCKTFTKQTGFDYSAHIKPKLVTNYVEGVIPFIQNKDFDGYNINFNTDYFIPFNVAKDFPRILLNEKCLLISISGSIGNVGVFSNNQVAFLGGAIAVAKFNDHTLIDWTMYYLRSPNGQNMMLAKVKTGSHQNLILDDIRKMLIPIPPKNEMQTIVTILSDMGNEIQELEKKLEKYKMLKQGMMQSLLTGKVRLV